MCALFAGPAFQWDYLLAEAQALIDASNEEWSPGYLDDGAVTAIIVGGLVGGALLIWGASKLWKHYREAGGEFGTSSPDGRGVRLAVSSDYHET